MYTQFDEKGKIFTPVVTKKPVSVIIQTTSHRIQGCVHIKPDERLKDSLERDEQYLAVTDAVIFDGQQELYRANFITINQAQIVWIIPADDLQDPGREHE